MFKQYRMDGLTEREKAERRRRLGIVQPHSAAVGPKPSDKPKDDRAFFCPTNITKTIARQKRRGFNGCKMSRDNAKLVEQREANRVAFLRSLGARV